MTFKKCVKNMTIIMEKMIFFQIDNIFVKKKLWIFFVKNYNDLLYIRQG